MKAHRAGLSQFLSKNTLKLVQAPFGFAHWLTVILSVSARSKPVYSFSSWYLGGSVRCVAHSSRKSTYEYSKPQFLVFALA